jgi:hypothetical protein
MMRINLVRPERRAEVARRSLSRFLGREAIKKHEETVSLRHEERRVVYCGDCGHSANPLDVCQWCGGKAFPLMRNVPVAPLLLDGAGVPVG